MVHPDAPSRPGYNIADAEEFWDRTNRQDWHICEQSQLGGLVDDWRPQTLDELTEADLEAVLALQPEIVVLGSGTRQRFPDPRLTAAIMARGIGCEVMDTGAACRTYNVLVSEGRRAVAALLLK
jgi:uncharacterized protein